MDPLLHFTQINQGKLFGKQAVMHEKKFYHCVYPYTIEVVICFLYILDDFLKYHCHIIAIVQ